MGKGGQPVSLLPDTDHTAYQSPLELCPALPGPGIAVAAPPKPEESPAGEPHGFPLESDKNEAAPAALACPSLLTPGELDGSVRAAQSVLPAPPPQVAEEPNAKMFRVAGSPAFGPSRDNAASSTGSRSRVFEAFTEGDCITESIFSVGSNPRPTND